MTIINPKQTSRPFVSPLMWGALVAVVLGATLNMLFYNQTVSIGHAIKKEAVTLEEARAENAVLKNSLYQTLDRGTLEARAREQGFVKITAPHYLAAH